MATPIELELRATPRTLTMAGRGAFEVGLVATNRGDAVIDPRLDLVELTVNGEPSIDWRAAIGNGGRDATWTALPPGQTIELGWPMGAQLFEHPGTYTLVLRHDDVETPAIEIEVTP